METSSEKHRVNPTSTKRIFRDAFFLLLVVGVLDFIGVKLYLFWSLHYYDSVVHFLAGICVGLAGVWLWMQYTREKMTTKQIVLIAFFAALTVGIIWEIFELSFGITLLSDGIYYVTDTASDLLMDVTGGIIAGLYVQKILKK